MENFARAFFSMRMMAAGMIVFLVAIAAATFFESAYDIQTAKIIIYNALWFELLLVFLGLNLIANIFRYNMLRREKIATLMFHLSFIIILIGAGVTRYISFEGLMMIREGEKSNFIYSSDPHIWFRVNDGKVQYSYSEKLFMSEITDNDFSIDVDFPKHATPIKIEYVNFQKKMIDSLVINDSIQGLALEIITDGMKSNFLTKGGFMLSGDVAISFEKKDAMPGIELIQKGSKIMVRSEQPMRYLPMSQMQAARQSGKEIADSLYVVIPADTLVPFQTTTLYQVGGQQIVFKKIINHAKKMLISSGKKKEGSDYLTVRVTDGKESKIIQLEGGMGAIPEHEVFSLGGLIYEMEYGSAKIDVPFYIACKDFQLDRYPGTEAPSSFASEVSIIDEKNKYTRNQRIFMNNVMDYGGFRFFQSSYDPDEKGTRLSVNHDWWGTNITYFGYLLMSIGMVLSLFAPVGRFRELNEKLRKSREKREQLMKIFILVFTLGISGFGQAQESHEGHDHAAHSNSDHTQQTATPPQKGKPVFGIMSKEHSDEIASLLVQDFEGRIVPMHTLGVTLLRKIHRADKFKEYNAVQTVVSMHMYPDYWYDQKIVYVSSNLKESFGITENYASIGDLLNEKNEFKLAREHELAHQKLESKRNEFDKNLIKLVDRYQVIQSFTAWSYMRLIPLKNDSTNTWYNPIDERVYQSDSVAFYTTLNYFKELFIAANSNDYTKSNEALVQLKKMQREVAAAIVPSETAVGVEISYNKMSIFKNSYRMYLFLGLILLVIFFVKIFVKPSPFVLKVFSITSKIFTALMIVAFVYHGIGLGFRWFISGHAPWSNGYEAVIFIAWVTMIAGFAFARKNPVILAGTAILAALMIFVTEMNLLDPEVTPLQPVLKSYWLMIHVAIITGSYGFLGLGAILGLLNLNLFIFRNKKNGKLVTMNINELTYVSEMTITVGLFMLTIGTFLGGIWANESWGRYWGWDPKETWALVSVLVYAVILHVRYIPALQSKFLFNTLSLWGYSAILFTFFGVNFYLVGLHSYAQGDGLGSIPPGIIVAVIVFIMLTLLASDRNKLYLNTYKSKSWSRIVFDYLVFKVLLPYTAFRYFSAKFTQQMLETKTVTNTVSFWTTTLYWLVVFGVILLAYEIVKKFLVKKTSN
jgi:cytochrome c-type biogenesis protein CcsB